MLSKIKKNLRKVWDFFVALEEACDWSPTDDLYVRVRELEKQMSELKAVQPQSAQ